MRKRLTRNNKIKIIYAVIRWQFSLKRLGGFSLGWCFTLEKEAGKQAAPSENTSRGCVSWLLSYGLEILQHNIKWEFSKDTIMHFRIIDTEILGAHAAKFAIRRAARGCEKALPALSDQVYWGGWGNTAQHLQF